MRSKACFENSENVHPNIQRTQNKSKEIRVFSQNFSPVENLNVYNDSNLSKLSSIYSEKSLTSFNVQNDLVEGEFSHLTTYRQGSQGQD